MKQLVECLVELVLAAAKSNSAAVSLAFRRQSIFSKTLPKRSAMDSNASKSAATRRWQSRSPEQRCRRIKQPALERASPSLSKSERGTSKFQRQVRAEQMQITKMV